MHRCPGGVLNEVGRVGPIAPVHAWQGGTSPSSSASVAKFFYTSHTQVEPSSTHSSLPFQNIHCANNHTTNPHRLADKDVVWIPAPPLTGYVLRWALSLPKPPWLYNCPWGWLRRKSKTHVQEPQYVPLQCSLWRSLITLLHTHCQTGLSRYSMEARVGRGISVCEHRKLPRTKEIFLWLHDFFKWSGQIKITGSFPILF